MCTFLPCRHDSATHRCRLRESAHTGRDTRKRVRQIVNESAKRRKNTAVVVASRNNPKKKKSPFTLRALINFHAQLKFTRASNLKQVVELNKKLFTDDAVDVDGPCTSTALRWDAVFGMGVGGMGWVIGGGNCRGCAAQYCNLTDTVELHVQGRALMSGISPGGYQLQVHPRHTRIVFFFCSSLVVIKSECCEAIAVYPHALGG